MHNQSEAVLVYYKKRRLSAGVKKITFMIKKFQLFVPLDIVSSTKHPRYIGLRMFFDLYIRTFYVFKFFNAFLFKFRSK